MHIFRSLIIGSVFVGLCAGAEALPLPAAQLYNNLSEPINNYIVLAGNPAGGQFTTNGTGTVTDVQLLLEGDPTNVGGSVLVTLWTDSGNYPDMPVGSPIGTILDTSMAPGGIFTVHDLPTSITGLDPNAPYWILLFDNSDQAALDGVYGGTSIVLAEAADDGGIGVAGGYYFTNYSSFSNSDIDSGGPVQMCVGAFSERGGSCPEVPEPASIGILGFALAGLGLLRRRRPA